MFRKLLVSLLFVGVVVIIGNITIVAQFSPISGRVVTVGADGKQAGVPGALVEIYRTDIKASLPAAKADKNGNFTFAGVPIAGSFILSVSAPNFSPQYFTRIKPGTENLILALTAGDGAKLTEEQVRKGADAAASGQTGELTAEQKKEQAEYEAKVNSIKSKNEKVQKTNEIVAASLKAGNDAYQAKNWDLAIAKYQEGIDADPDFAGTAPVFYNNRGAALRSRATDTYNSSVKNTDVTASIEGKGKAKQDMLLAVQGYLKAYNLVKNAPATEAADKGSFETSRVNSIKGAMDMLRIAAKTELVDPGMIDAAKVLIPEDMAIETDATKKAEAQMVLADLYRVSGDFQNAVDAYKQILATSPDNPDALAGAGLCLFALGAMNNNDKTAYQEGANFLAKYVSVAPDGHKYKTDVAAVLEQLKNEQKVTPQKTTGTGKKRG